MRVCIPGDAGTYRNYGAAIRRAGGVPCFHGAPETCGCLLLPGGGDLEPWRYGQENTASRGLDPCTAFPSHTFLATLIAANPPLRSPTRSIAKYRISTVGPTGSHPLRVCQPGPCLDTASLLPPPAALRRCPWHAVY